jgi:hypothetical protein
MHRREAVNKRLAERRPYRLKPLSLMPMPTIYDVAKRAGVSTYTVSSVLNRSAYVSPELTKRVEEAVRELDYIWPKEDTAKSHY